MCDGAVLGCVCASTGAADDPDDLAVELVASTVETRDRTRGAAESKARKHRAETIIKILCATRNLKLRGFVMISIGVHL